MAPGREEAEEESLHFLHVSRNVSYQETWQQLTSSKISDSYEIDFRQRVRNAEVVFVER